MKILSGIQPSESIHIGNYFGSINQWLTIQNNNQCIFFIADLHGLTTYNYKKFNIYEKSLELLATYLACGLSENNIFFIQSQVLNHSYFSWILSTITPLGEINRMVQMKDKSKDYDNVGILTYPILMASDILLYNPEYVPVGQDQYQHLELTRTIASKLNNLLRQDYFHKPKAIIEGKKSIKIQDLKDGSKKMSKSNPQGCLFFTDDANTIVKKIMKAKTDSYPMPQVNEDYSHRLEITNLINIYGLITAMTNEQVVEKFQGQSLSGFKQDLAQKLVDFIIPIQKKIFNLLENKEYLINLLDQGKLWAIDESNTTLKIINEYFLGR